MRIYLDTSESHPGARTHRLRYYLCMNLFTDWENFYVILGSAAGALIGLQFVSMAIIADVPLGPGGEESSAAFSTPSVMHFTAVLTLSAVLSMPWHSVAIAAIVCEGLGAAGVVYMSYVAWRMVQSKAYKAVLEDWAFRIVMPLALYAGLLAAAAVTRAHTRPGAFGLAAVALGLMFVGIHHAWDNVVYLVFRHREHKHRKP